MWKSARTTSPASNTTSNAVVPTSALWARLTHCPAPPRRTSGWRRLGKGPSYRRNGQQSSFEEVLTALEQMPNYKGKLRLTVIGSKADRAALEKDWQSSPELAGLKDAYVYKGYEPSHWHVAKYGFVTDG